MSVVIQIAVGLAIVWACTVAGIVLFNNVQDGKVEDFYGVGFERPLYTPWLK